MSEIRLKNSKRSGNHLQIIGVLIPVLVLSAWGLITIFSAGTIQGPEKLVNKQGMWLFVALLGFIVAYRINLDFLKKLTLPIAITTFALLVAVFIPGIGKTVKGSTRWVEFASLTIQPSDFAKITLVLCLAAILQHFQRDIKSFLKGTLPPICIIGAVILPIVAEPDFGTTALCLGVGVAVMFMAGVNLTHLAAFGLAGASAVVAAVLHNPNRLMRLGSFLDRENQAQEGGYQLTQALYGFGRGQITGVGLGEGRQQYSYLPEAHTDFILVNIAEELGLVGTMGVLLLFFIIFITVISNIKKAKNLYEFTICFGAILMLIGQALFNMCVVMGLLPTKGISLPFISYGGSNLVVMFIFTGLILNCLKSWNAPQKIKATDYE